MTSDIQKALKVFADLGVGSGPDHETETYQIERGAIRNARAALELKSVVSVDAVLAELMDRRLLNDVDSDLHQEIAEAVIKAAQPAVDEDGPLSIRDLAMIDQAWENHKAALPVATVVNDNQPGRTAIIEITIDPPTLPVGTKLYAGPKMVELAAETSPGDYDPEFVASILHADAVAPEAKFNNTADMLNWLNRESPGDVVAILRKCRDYIASDIRMSRDEDEKARRDSLVEEATAAANRLDVKAEAKSQEPVAVAWRRRRKGIVGNGGWIMCPEYPGRDREFDLEHLYTHPTKPEAPAVSVDAIKDIAAERQRQISVEGWSPAHDDTHEHGELAKAAACYAVGYIIQGHTVSLTRTNSWSLWSWDLEWWKPKDRRANLVRAGALIVAEIERLDRAAL